MFDTEPRVLPHVEGVRNPRRQAIGAALAAEIRAHGLDVKCLFKVIRDVGGAIKYPRLLGIVNGAVDPRIDELAVICDVLAIRFEDLAATAAESTIKEKS